MWLDDLSELVDRMAVCINTHRDILNESTTRYALIDPLLSALGWRLADPAQVRTEYTTGDAAKTRRLDYTMWQDKRICLIVEAKALGKSLDDDATEQAITYCFTAGCQHFLVTDGNQWRGYDLLSEGELEDKRMFSFTVTERRGVMDLFWLWPGNFKGDTKQPKFHGRSVDEVLVSANTPSPTSPRRATSGVPLPDVTFDPEMDKPRRLVFPDGETKDVSASWASVQPATAEWLIDHHHVQKLPLCNRRGTHLLHKSPTKRTGRPFGSPRQVRNHWIDMRFGPENHLKKAAEMLESCDLDPATVRLEFD